MASIDLHLEPRGGRTALPGIRHQGPLRVQRPFYPEGPVCHIYLLHPPGGLVSGDQLRISATLEPDSQALITTPSAGKIYRGDSCGVSQQQTVLLRLAANSSLEWLPQETIIYDGALGHSQTRVDLSKGCRFIGWEIICLGHPASHLHFNRGRFNRGRFIQEMAIYRDGLPLVLEKQHLQAASPLAEQRWGLAGYPIVGTLYAVGFDKEPVALIDALRAQLNEDQATEGENLDEQVAITYRLGVLILRYLGTDSERARTLFTRQWQLIRPELLCRAAAIPRIWLT
ncbi:MAG: urease accessory protein [Motiliproteus sp.]|jgi:urease accessory protein